MAKRKRTKTYKAPQNTTHKPKEAVNRRTDNAMAKRKRTKTYKAPQNTTHKPKDWASRTPQEITAQLLTPVVLLLNDTIIMSRDVI